MGNFIDPMFFNMNQMKREVTGGFSNRYQAFAKKKEPAIPKKSSPSRWKAWKNGSVSEQKPTEEEQEVEQEVSEIIEAGPDEHAGNQSGASHGEKTDPEETVRQEEMCGKPDLQMDPKRLREAVIWAEILGEPVSRRRRKERMRR